jgi:hypothetical protein
MARLSIAEIDIILRTASGYSVKVEPSRIVSGLRNLNTLIEYVRQYAGPVSARADGWEVSIPFGGKRYTIRFAQANENGECVLSVKAESEI